MNDKNIEFKNLEVQFKVGENYLKAVDNISLLLKPDDITGIIGESGCGKSILGLSIIGLLPKYAIIKGDVSYKGNKITKMGEKEIRKLHGKEISLIPQNPGESLNPMLSIGNQMFETFKLVDKNRYNIKEKAIDLLKLFGFEFPQKIFKKYPFEMSGGMQQRVLCTLAMGTNPSWIIADEPTKGLDIDLREQVYKNILSVKLESNVGMIIITHDLVLAREICDRIIVMYSGEILESGKNILSNPMHPYTKGFLMSLPENGFKPMEGIAPYPGEIINGCKFASRCEDVMDKCFKEKPGEIMVGDRMVRCFLYD